MLHKITDRVEPFGYQDMIAQRYNIIIFCRIRLLIVNGGAWKIVLIDKEAVAMYTITKTKRTFRNSKERAKKITIETDNKAVKE